MLLLFAMMPFLVVLGAMLWNRHVQSLPDNITIAGGLKRGVYNGISQKIANRISATHGTHATVIGTGGSIDNRSMLLSKEVSLAPMQESAISGDQLCVVAPLIKEAAHLLVRASADDDSAAKWSVDQLKGSRIAVGPIGSGSRRVADMILESLELDPSVTERVVIPWMDLEKKNAPPAALICVGRGSSLVTELIESGWRLQPIPNSMKVIGQHPTLLPMTIMESDYPAQRFPAEGIQTVGTTGFLATRYDAPDALIQATLQALYEPPLDLPGFIPIDQAMEKQSYAFHPVARRYFSAVSTSAQ